MTYDEKYSITIYNGDEVVHEISIESRNGKTTYEIQLRNGVWWLISFEELKAIIAEADSKGYQIFDFDQILAFWNL